MARIMMAGNELYDMFSEGWTVFAGAPTVAVNQPGGRRTLQGNGGKHYYYLDASTGLFQIGKLLPNLATGPATGGYTEVYGRFAYFSAQTTAKTMFTLRNSNTGLIVGTIRMLDLGNPNCRLQVWNGSGPTLLVNDAVATNFVTGGSATGNFTRVEFHFKCAASGGIWEVWVDDVLRISNSSLNTANGTTVVFDQILIGQQEATTETNYYDDIAINDLTGTVNNGRVGEGVIIALWPTRQGTFNDLVNTFNTTKESYDHVNRPVTAYIDPKNNSLYVGTNTPGTKSTFQVNGLPAEFGGISAVKPVLNTVRNGAALTNVKTLLEPGVTVPLTAPTGALAAGGAATPGAHEFVAVNKIGTGYSLPSPVSATFTTTGPNATVNLTVPVSLDPRVTAREVYASKAGLPGTYYLVGTIPDNVTTAFSFAIADGSFGTLTQPVEMASANLLLPNGGFGYVENIYDKNPTTGLAWTHDEIETIEVGLQFNT